MLWLPLALAVFSFFDTVHMQEARVCGKHVNEKKTTQCSNAWFIACLTSMHCAELKNKEELHMSLLQTKYWHYNICVPKHVYSLSH